MMTRYWFDCVKIVETIRWPKASYSALSTVPDADAETRRAVAVDGDVGGETVVFLIADHIRELGLLAKRREQLRRPCGQRRRVGAFQGELILRAADGVVESQVLHGLHVQRDAGDVGGLGLQPPDDIGDARSALRCAASS